jgi:hypothetical protein
VSLMRQWCQPCRRWFGPKTNLFLLKPEFYLYSNQNLLLLRTTPRSTPPHGDGICTAPPRILASCVKAVGRVTGM